MNSVCFWKEDEEGTWQSGCGHAFQFHGENDFSWCPYCGDEIDSEIYLSAEDIAAEKGDRQYHEMKDLELE